MVGEVLQQRRGRDQGPGFPNLPGPGFPNVPYLLRSTQCNKGSKGHTRAPRTMPEITRRFFTQNITVEPYVE